MQTLVVPEKVLIEINRLLFRFLWRKKNYNRRAFEKVKRSVLCTDVESGGLNMTGLKDMQVAFLFAVFFASMQGEESWEAELDSMTVHVCWSAQKQ